MMIHYANNDFKLNSKFGTRFCQIRDRRSHKVFHSSTLMSIIQNGSAGFQVH